MCAVYDTKIVTCYSSNRKWKQCLRFAVYDCQRHIPGCELHDLFVNVCLMVRGLWSVCGCVNHVERSLNVWGGMCPRTCGLTAVCGDYVSWGLHIFVRCPCMWSVWPDLERTFQYLSLCNVWELHFQFVRSLICLGNYFWWYEVFICLIMCLPEC